MTQGSNSTTAELKWKLVKARVTGVDLDGKVGTIKKPMISALGTGLAYNTVEGEEFADGRARTSVTHVNSGYRMGPWFFNSENARKLIEKIAPLGNWNLSHEELSEISSLQASFKETLRAMSVEYDAEYDDEGVRTGETYTREEGE